MSSENRETKEFVYMMILIKRLAASFINFRSHMIRDEAQNQGEKSLISQINEFLGME
jgi:hypothetical protein